MLGGRIDVRRGVTAILGCFILFGAASIVVGLQSASPGPDGGPLSSIAETPPPPLPPTPASGYDPYAGASVPTR